MAPEVMERKLHSAKVDIYSFGLMMWEMWFGKRVLTDVAVKIYSDELKTSIIVLKLRQSDLSLRRTASECKDIIKTIKQKHVK